MITKLKKDAAGAGGAAASESSTFRGVALERKSGRWTSRIMIDNKNTNLGMFAEEEEAARAYDRMSIWCKIHGKTKQGGYTLNFDRGNYAIEEAALTAVDTMEAMVKKIREVAAHAAWGSSRFRGVSLGKKTGRWKSQIRIDNKDMHLGTFVEEEAAARAYDRMSIWCRIHGKTKQGGYTLNFDSSNYASEEAALTAVDTMEAMVKEIREVAARASGVAAWGISTFRGVCHGKKTGRWKSQIRIDNKDMHLGTFVEEEAAARAYDRMSIWCRIHGKMKKAGYMLNFDSSNYASEEAALTAVDTMEAMVKEIREVAARASGVAALGISTFRGVCHESGQWKSQIMIDNKNTHLGMFDEEEEAARAYDRMFIWCKIHGKTKEGGYTLNFDRRNYAGDEAELRICTQADLMKQLKWGKTMGMEEEESVGSGRGQKRKKSSHNEDDDDNAVDDSDEEADDDRGDAYIEDDDNDDEADNSDADDKDDDVSNHSGDNDGGDIDWVIEHGGDDDCTASGKVGGSSDYVTVKKEEYGAEVRNDAEAVSHAVNGDGGGSDKSDDNCGSDTSNGNASDTNHNTAVKLEPIEDVPQVTHAFTGQDEVNGASSDPLGCPGAAAVLLLGKGDAGGDHQRGSSSADEKPPAKTVVKEEPIEEIPRTMDDASPPRRCSSRVNKQPVKIKREDREDGIVCCPRCKGGVLASERGCNIVTCTVYHEMTLNGTEGGGCGGFCYFCFHCGVENNGETCPSSMCPHRVDRVSRAAALTMRNADAARTPIDLRDD